MKSILTFLSAILVVGCYSSREIKYDYSQSKPKTKQVFISGEASCSNGYCFQIIKEDSTKCSYTLYGNKPIGISGKMKVKKKNNGISILVKVRLTNLLGQRDKANELKMLDQIENQK